MGVRKSSRIINMNYSYTIQHSNIYNDKEVLEFINDKFNHSWYLSALKTSIVPFTNYDSKSFHRTKKWIIENYPEFLI